MPAANVVQPRGIFLTTTDGTATAGFTFQTQTNVSYNIEVHAIATDGSNTAGYKRIATFENNNGTLAQVGSTSSPHTAEDLANPGDVVFSVSGTVITLSVTGDPGRSMRWAIYPTIYPSRVA